MDAKTFYEQLAPELDPGGFKLYFTAQRLTGFELYKQFPYEDSRGMFEMMNGHQLIRIEDTVYEGTGTEIMDQLRKAAFDPTEFPDTESYIWQLRSNFIRMTDQDCILPDRGVEAQAQTMIMALAKIGALEVLDHG